MNIYNVKTNCSYCSNAYKTHLTKPPNFIGGYIDGYWFCKSCIEYGLKNKTNSEKERIENLKDVARNRSNKNIDFLN